MKFKMLKNPMKTLINLESKMCNFLLEPDDISMMSDFYETFYDLRVELELQNESVTKTLDVIKAFNRQFAAELSLLIEDQGELS